MNNNFKQYELSISAFNDSLVSRIEKNNIIYSKKVPQIDINTLIKSEFFKTLDENQKQYYKELSKIKSLISSNQIELSKLSKLSSESNISSNVILYDDSIKFLRGHEITFKELDTNNKFQWNSKITIDSITKFDFDYKYDLKVKTDFIRNKDKSIKIEYTLDDKDILMNKSYSFIIPFEEKTKYQKFIDNNKRWLYPTIGGILVGSGIYIGKNVIK